MAELKSARTEASVDAFLAEIEDPVKREDARALDTLIRHETGEEPAMYGTAIVGYGLRRVRYANGKEIDWLALGFSPRKANLTLYLPGTHDRLMPLIERLGKCKTNGGCVSVKRLSDVDLDVLREMVRSSVEAPG